MLQFTISYMAASVLHPVSPPLNYILIRDFSWGRSVMLLVWCGLWPRLLFIFLCSTDCMNVSSWDEERTFCPVLHLAAEL